MPTLILLRHAKSDYPLGVPDHDRPLSDRGRRNAVEIAEHLRPFLASASSVGVAVSTAVRAQQTWVLAAMGLPQPRQRWDDRQLYLAEPHDLVEVSRAFDTEVGILVGHNPGLAQLAAGAQAADQAIAESLQGKFATATFAVLRLEDQSWSNYAEMTCAAIVRCR